MPAAFNNIVGLKPSRGLLSTRGIVPACRSLDCVSIFALTAQDAGAVLDVAAGYDPDDPLSRRPPAAPVFSFGSGFRFGVPPAKDLDFFGDDAAEALFIAAVAMLEAAGGTRVETSFAPFRDAGRMLYDGPWVAERLHATEQLLTENPDALLPITRTIIERGRGFSALDAFRAQYRLAAVRRAAEEAMATVDCLLLPTAGTTYEIGAVMADPVRLNTNLGLYTNFAKLLDLSAVALPAGFRNTGLPFGISLLAPAFADRALLDLAARFQRRIGLPLGTAQALGGDIDPACRCVISILAKWAKAGTSRIVTWCFSIFTMSASRNARITRLTCTTVTPRTLPI